jgi:CheY-like chemotaxis protein/predicted regulator of Ras-like GTPase activity (Roadblock/LC7/MglB family)
MIVQPAPRKVGGRSMANEAKTVNVLVVDDEPIMRAAAAESLQQLGDQYRVDLASSGDEALIKLRLARYALVLTDYEMDEPNGLQLAKMIKRMSPETRVVLMASTGSPGLRDTALRQGLDGYVDKPFTLKSIQGTIAAALAAEETTASPAAMSTARPSTPTRAEPSPATIDAEVEALLGKLLQLSRARCVILLRTDGHPVQAVGQTGQLHIPTLGALIAATFAATAELSRQLGNTKLFQASNHAGLDSNVYTYAVGADHLLAIVFGSESLAGAVWVFARQIASQLAHLGLAQPSKADLGDDLASAVDAGLDELFGGLN